MRPTVIAIKKHVAAYYGLQLSDMTCAARRRSVARPRQVAMYIAKATTPRTLPELGRLFHRNHTTILTGIRRINVLMAENPRFRGEVDEIMTKILAGGG